MLDYQGVFVWRLIMTIIMVINVGHYYQVGHRFYYDGFMTMFVNKL